MGLDMTYEALQGELSVAAVRDTRIISISVTDHDPYQARELANAIREEAGERIKSVMNIEAVNVVEEANIPDKKAGPNLKRSLLLGLLLGAFAVLAYFTLMFILDDKVNDAEDVERYLGLSVLGQLPIDENLQKMSKKKKNVHRRKAIAARR